MLKQKEKIEREVFKLVDKLRFDEALSLIEIQRLYAKKDPFYYAIYGIVHIYMRKFNDARLFINKALNLDPYNEMALNAIAYIELAEGKVQEAIHIYIRILDLNPYNKLVKSNLDRFKGKKDLSKILLNINPNNYIREKESYLFKYQKILSIFLILACTIILLVYNYNGSNDEANLYYIKQRIRYKELNYFSSGRQKEEELFNDAIPIDESKVISLNNILASNIPIKKKIEIEHKSRVIVFNYLNDRDTLHTISYPQTKDLFSKVYKYDDITVILNGKITKEGNIKYIINTFEGYSIKLLDTNKVIPTNNKILQKPIKLLIKINSSKELEPYATVLSILK